MPLVAGIWLPNNLTASIEVDLDLRPDGLKRIAVYMDHPAARDFHYN